MTKQQAQLALAILIDQEPRDKQLEYLRKFNSERIRLDLLAQMWHKKAPIMYAEYTIQSNIALFWRDYMLNKLKL